MTSQPDERPRFSRLYLERSQPTSDSQRLRVRLGHFVRNDLQEFHSEITGDIASELGVDAPYSGGGRNMVRFFAECASRDYLTRSP